MEGIHEPISTTSRTRGIVYAGLTAAAYAVTTIALGPLSYGPIQLRLSGLLKPLALKSPVMAWGLAIGVLLADLVSPFGFWDWGTMPIVSFVAALFCWKLRRWPILGLLVQAGIIAVGVAFFPLGIGAKIPFWPTVIFIFFSEAAIYVAGYYIIWKRFPHDL